MKTLSDAIATRSPERKSRIKEMTDEINNKAIISQGIQREESVASIFKQNIDDIETFSKYRDFLVCVKVAMNNIETCINQAKFSERKEILPTIHDYYRKLKQNYRDMFMLDAADYLVKEMDRLTEQQAKIARFFAESVNYLYLLYIENVWDIEKNLSKEFNNSVKSLLQTVFDELMSIVSDEQFKSEVSREILEVKIKLQELKDKLR